MEVNLNCLKDFCNYKKGQIVAFNGADAERFAKNISGLEPLKVVNTFDTKEIKKVEEKMEILGNIVQVNIFFKAMLKDPSA